MDYKILLLPLIAGFIAQISKFLVKSNKEKFKFKKLLDYSGMPSGHSAIVSSLATIILFQEGINSPLFSISVVLAIIVMRDAVGIRRYLGQHGRTLNILVEDLKEDKMLDNNYPHLLEKIGHTNAQVLVGSCLGILVSLLGFYFF